MLFNGLVNDLNGLVAPSSFHGSSDDAGDGYLLSSVRGRHFGWTEDQVAAAVRDKTWTKAVFLRDPLERLLAAYFFECNGPLASSPNSFSGTGSGGSKQGYCPDLEQDHTEHDMKDGVGG